MVALVGVFLEYVALSVMLPLSMAEPENGGLSSWVRDIWHVVVAALGFPENSKTWIWLFLIFLGLRISVGYLQLILNTWVSKRIHAHLSGGIFSHVVLAEPMAEIYRRSVGHYTALGGDEAVRVGQVFFNIAQMLSALVAALIGLIVLYIFSPFVFKLTLIFLLISAIAIALVMKYVFTWSNESALLCREATTTFIEALNGIRSIRSMAGERFATQRYHHLINRYARILFFLDIFNHGTKAIPGLILIMLGAIVLFPSTNSDASFSAVYFFTATTMLIRVLSFMGAAVSSGGRALIDIRSALDLNEVISKSEQLTVEAQTNSKCVVHSVGSLSMRSLACGYEVGRPVLSEISLDLVAGRSYALIGKSGSGKSTLSDVILGLLRPMSGELSIDGVSYDQFDLTSLRRKVVLVEQQTRIFSGSIRENIAFGLSPTDAEINVAVEASGLTEFIATLPKGLETHLDYQGANLSGGQRQRIGLARAIIRQPDVLILDEATSALDSQTRDAVLKNLFSLLKDRILLFITHDGHITQSVDEVWHIRKGKLIVENHRTTMR